MTQDDFFNVRLEDPTDYGPDRPNLETPEGVDWAALLSAIDAARATLAGAGGAGPEGKGLVVVEGFLLLASAKDGSSALSLFDAVFFLDCPAEECLRRRLARNPDRSAEQAAGAISRRHKLQAFSRSLFGHVFGHVSAHFRWNDQS